MFDQKKFARVFEESGLTKSELASLYSVTRQTIYDWYGGKSEPTQTHTRQREELYTKGLLAAIERGVLPVKAKEPKQRKERVLAMAQALHALTKPR